MNLTDLLPIIVAVAVLAAIIWLANHVDATGKHRAGLHWLLYGIIFMALLTGLNALVAAVVPPDALQLAPDTPPPPDISLPAGLTILGLALLGGGASLAAIISPAARRFVARIVGPNASYNPDSAVHLTALVLALCSTAVLLGNLLAQGGVAGVAEQIEQIGISAIDIVIQLAAFIALSLLGVGLAMRRQWPAAAQRLGIADVGVRDFRNGALAGLALFGLALVLQMIWALVISPEALAEQTQAAEQISSVLSESLPLIVLVSLAAGVGEELFFRGAVQPVFGIYLTSAFFAVIHTQYAFTYATALILIVGVGLGWLRQRYGTVAAMVAHFTYNFVQLFLLYLAVRSGIEAF